MTILTGLMIGCPQESYGQSIELSPVELCRVGRQYEADGKDQEALEYYKKAAELQDPEGMFLYGDMLRFKPGSIDDKTTGYIWIEKSAKAGYKEAIPIIGWIYFNGGVEWPRDYSKALPYLLESSDFDQESNTLLGKMYFYGLDVTQDYEKALYYLLKSEANWGEVNYLLTQCYALGLGTEQNNERAQHYWNLLVNSPYSDSLFCLGHSYYYGILTKQDYTKAATYLQKSADQNYWPAQFLLSKCYRFGRGVEQNISKADQLLGEALYGDYDALLVSKMFNDN